jgi:hypothetical protein
MYQPYLGTRLHPARRNPRYGLITTTIRRNLGLVEAGLPKYALVALVRETSLSVMQPEHKGSCGQARRIKAQDADAAPGSRRGQAPNWGVRRDSWAVYRAF